jgi:hypothetical protein
MKTITALILTLVLGACSSGASFVRTDPFGGLVHLSGPYVPAMEEARELMAEHCHGRFVTHEEDRDVLFHCVRAD